jgi:WD40 repeat protein
LLFGRQRLLAEGMMRFAVPACFLQDGKTIISGWSDGKIRGFGPQSGKLLYTINDAHHKAVTAIAVTSDSNRVISGGEEGELHTPQLTRVFAALHPSTADICTS